MASKLKVGVLGGGQLGRMMAEPANRLNIQINVLDKGNAPAKKISDGQHVDGAFTDEESIEEIAKVSDVVTVEIEHVNVDAMETVQKKLGTRFEPSPQTIRIIQNKFHQKQHLQKYNIAVAEYEEVTERNMSAVATIGSKLGYPFMLKSQTQAYDGKGNYPVKSEKDIEPALKALSSRPLYAEKWAKFRMELAVMVVKTKDEVLSFPTVETVHEDSICKLVYAPARNVSSKINTQAQALARDAIAAFEGKGVFGVEMFLLEDDTLLINEIAPRPHNSGHYTIEACPISQYEAHIRAILDLPIPKRSLRLKEPAIMLNILGGADANSDKAVAQAALDIPDASIHLYSKGDSRPGRKMGHITVTSLTMGQCEKTIQPLVNLTDKIRVDRTDIGPPDTKPSGPSSQTTPQVGVIMGSDSDLNVLKPGLDLLENKFGISVDIDITSAHRTPHKMDEYARTAADRGIKVIIAAAGGAAHLPGMAASHTTLPVVGVPVKGSVFDGQDSLLSMVQMPPGVPLGVMGVNNSKNAALYAARIIGAYDATVKEKYEAFVKEMEEEVLAKGKKLREVGWADYKRE